MSKDKIKKMICEMLLNMFWVVDFDAYSIEYADLIDDLGIDSITFISLIIAIESEFGIHIPDEELVLDNFRNVESVVRIVECELNGGTINE
jgi:acyl carrier protein